MIKYLFWQMLFAISFLCFVAGASWSIHSGQNAALAAEKATTFQTQLSGTCEVVCTKPGIFYCKAVTRDCN